MEELEICKLLIQIDIGVFILLKFMNMLQLPADQKENNLK